MKKLLQSHTVIKILKRSYKYQAIVFASILSITAWFVYYRNGLVTSYNDAMYHINISRMIIDNMQPGFSQLGGVWLPLNHILSLALVWNDWAWRSGFAGSVVSMSSYIVSVWMIYATLWNVTKKHWASLIGALCFALNLNILYLQATPLTEPLYVALFCISIYIFVRYILTNHTNYLLLLGALGFMQVLTRYDGWFVVGIEGLLIMYHEYVNRKKTIHEITGKIVLFAFPVIFGIVLWLLWNTLIFGNPLFFAIGPYSARSQQHVLEAQNSLITKGNPWLSFLAYWYAIEENVGQYVLSIGLLAIPLFFKTKFNKINTHQKWILVVFLSAPILFNILALFLGFSVLKIPELALSKNPSEMWFNVRYGILALPMICVMVGIFASWRKLLSSIITIQIIVLQIVVMSSSIITITDGTIGASSFNNQDTAQYLKNKIQGNDVILLSANQFSPVVYKSDVQFKQVLHEGVRKFWEPCLKHPQTCATWIVMTKYDVGDPVYTELIKNQQNEFLKFYTLDFSGKRANIYKLKSSTIIGLNNYLLPKQ